MILIDLRRDIKKLADPEKAKFLMRFFKTGKGQYGEGDVFLGIVVPDSRKLALKYKTLPQSDVKVLLQSKLHEERLIALLILVLKYQDAEKKSRSHFAKASRDKKDIVDFYLAHTKCINNWDLVDLSADKIVGEYLFKNRHRADSGKVLVTLAKSQNMWERRIAIIATYAFIRNGEHEVTFEIADILLHDSHDLIQKAVGWMLREVGKRASTEKEEEFLKTRYKTMPRTALRYAIEKFPEEKRKKYLEGSI